MSTSWENISRLAMEYDIGLDGLQTSAGAMMLALLDRDGKPLPLEEYATGPNEAKSAEAFLARFPAKAMLRRALSCPGVVKKPPVAGRS